jgi:hypothetical protein
MRHHCSTFLIIAVMGVIWQPAHAQFKCKKADGSVTFQQTFCDPAEQQERIRLYEAKPNPVSISAGTEYKLKAAELERRRQISLAITSGQPMVSMTRQELDRAMGDPDKINAAQYGSSLQDQMIYYRDGRTIYVYTKDGVVTSIQIMEGSPVAARQTKACPSSREIWEIEIEINKLANRDNQRLQTMLHQQLIEAKACR